jgi:hypothetical protein
MVDNAVLLPTLADPVPDPVLVKYANAALVIAKTATAVSARPTRFRDLKMLRMEIDPPVGC